MFRMKKRDEVKTRYIIPSHIMFLEKVFLKQMIGRKVICKKVICKKKFERNLRRGRGLHEKLRHEIEIYRPFSMHRCQVSWTRRDTHEFVIIH